MQVGIVLATTMVFALSTLTPESSYAYEAVLMALLGAGLGVVMPVMNLAVQNEFKQQDLGVATSSSQLFRSLGSTIGVAVFGAILTTGLASNIGSIAGEDPYVQQLKQSEAVAKLGDIENSDTLLNLNMPETKQKITESFEQGIAELPVAAQEPAKRQFEAAQADFSYIVTHAFSDSLQRIFRIAGTLMLGAVVLVFMLKEKPLRAADPEQTPGL